MISLSDFDFKSEKYHLDTSIGYMLVFDHNKQTICVWPYRCFGCNKNTDKHIYVFKQTTCCGAQVSWSCSSWASESNPVSNVSNTHSDNELWQTWSMSYECEFCKCDYVFLVWYPNLRLPQLHIRLHVLHTLRDSWKSSDVTQKAAGVAQWGFFHD